MPHVLHPRHTKDQEMTDTRIETAVALLRARDETIAALQATIREKDITIRHLKSLLAEQDAELLAVSAPSPRCSSTGNDQQAVPLVRR
jgi:hypothetical protein